MKKNTAKIEAILVADKQDTFVSRRVPKIDLDYGGIKGDLHFGLTKKAGTREKMYPRGTEIFNRRQITIVSEEECAEVSARLGIERILPEWLGANILISGFSGITQLAEGSRILFPSGVGLLCEGENDPCTQPGKVLQRKYPAKEKLAPRFVKAAMGLRGIVAIVERPGKIYRGEQIEILT